MPAYKLTYFNMKVLGEPIRMLLAYGGVEFEDNRIERVNWPALKPTTPFGKMPILEVDGKKVHQSLAICRFLGRQFKVAGDDDWESLEVDVMADTVNDLWARASDYLYSTMAGFEAEAVAKKDALVKDTLPYYLPKLDAIVNENNGHFVNGKLTWVDIFFSTIMETLGAMLGLDVLKEYPNLLGLQAKVLALPAIKAWVAKRPASEL